MQGHQHQEEGEVKEEPSPESAFEKSPFQLTAEDVYDISYLVGREILKISSEPQGEVPTRVAQLQFKIVRILEMLEALVNESNLTVEELKMERDNLRKEVEGLRKEGPSGNAEQLSLGPDKMIIDLTDPNRPRFTLQELRDVLQERNQLKAQLLITQEELQCFKSGIISQREDQAGPMEKESTVCSPSGSSKSNEEKTIIKHLFSFKYGKRI
ncbi:RILP-like protein 2 [Trachemys scripta elegans]|uniref:RILP-like protein 2 n=1 Tax=Trachemys scripta elegans TaxID=31138 RepID=UPI00155218EA|nr:RILP-like protein 2 [Trachemys scripta elegans]